MSILKREVSGSGMRPVQKGFEKIAAGYTYFGRFWKLSDLLGDPITSTSRAFMACDTPIVCWSVFRGDAIGANTPLGNNTLYGTQCYATGSGACPNPANKYDICVIKNASDTRFGDGYPDQPLGLTMRRSPSYNLQMFSSNGGKFGPPGWASQGIDVVLDKSGSQYRFYSNNPSSLTSGTTNTLYLVFLAIAKVASVLV